MKIFFKNMYCDCCKTILKSELENLGLHILSLRMGEAEVLEDLSDEKINTLYLAIRKSGMEVLNKKNDILVELIKNTIIQQINNKEDQLKTNLSNYLAKRLHYNYKYLAKLFMLSEGTTISKFSMSKRIDKVKELLTYNELNINQISEFTHFSSSSHMSNQFKKSTGLTPFEFKNLNNHNAIGYNQ